MATARIDPRAGWCNPAKLPYGPNGRALCRHCGEEVPVGRRSFCGDACVDEWKVRTDPSHVRRLVLKRDQGVCRACGLDCEALERYCRALSGRHPDADRPPHSAAKMADRAWWRWGQLQVFPGLRRAGFEVKSYWFGYSADRSFWQADHVIEVQDGGGGCGLDGYQTLCTACHKEKTSRLRRQRAGLPDVKPVKPNRAPARQTALF